MQDFGRYLLSYFAVLTGSVSSRGSGEGEVLDKDTCENQTLKAGI